MPSPTPIIGLTGAIGSGKSTVARMLGEMGGLVVDADANAKEALELPEVRQQLIDWWGPGVLDERGREAIGSTVRLESGPSVQYRQVQRTTSYCASNDPRVHFGLGDLDAVDRVTVTWIGGGEEEFGGTSVIYIGDVPLNEILRVPTTEEFEKLRVPQLATMSVPEFVHKWVLVTPFQFATVSAGLATVWFLRRRARLMAERAAAARPRKRTSASSPVCVGDTIWGCVKR